jgi:hypothetical protein
MHIDGPYVDRYTLVANGSLRIENIHLSDNDTYECRWILIDRGLLETKATYSITLRVNGECFSRHTYDWLIDWFCRGTSFSQSICFVTNRHTLLHSRSSLWSLCGALSNDDLVQGRQQRRREEKDAKVTITFREYSAVGIHCRTGLSLFAEKALHLCWSSFFSLSSSLTVSLFNMLMIERQANIDASPRIGLARCKMNFNYSFEVRNNPLASILSSCLSFSCSGSIYWRHFPVSQTIKINQSVTLKCEGESSEPLQYQWYAEKFNRFTMLDVLLQAERWSVSLGSTLIGQSNPNLQRWRSDDREQPTVGSRIVRVHDQQYSQRHRDSQ